MPLDRRLKEYERRAAAMGNGDQPDGDESSWMPIDVVEAGKHPPEPPTVGKLFYPGKRHIVFGREDAGKTFLLLCIAAAEIQAGRRVVWIDVDGMGPASILERLRQLGCSDEQHIAPRFVYLRPSEPLADRTVLVELAQGASLVVVDAFTAWLDLHDLDQNDAAEVERGYALLNPVRDSGVAAIVLDHIHLAQESRDRPLGSQRKTTGADLALGVVPARPIGRGQAGQSRVRVRRDRVGFLKGRPVTFDLTSAPDNGRLSWHVDVGVVGEGGGEFRPTGYMERASKWLEENPGQHTQNEVEGGVGGNAKHIRTALGVLVHDGFVAQEIGARNSLLYEYLKPYRVALDGES